MSNKPFRISTGQAILLVSIANLGAAHLYVPALSYQVLGRSGWLLPLAAVAIGGLGGMLFKALSSRFPGRSFFQAALHGMGRTGGSALSLLLIISILAYTIMVSRVFTDLVASELLPRTPLAVISPVVLLISGYAALHGIEALVRLTQIFSLLVVPAAVLFILVPLLLPLQPGHLIPVAIRPMQSAWLGFTALLSAFPGFVLLSAVAPSLDRPANAGRVAFWGTVLPALVVVPATLYPVMAFGWPAAGDYSRPYWEVLAIIRPSVGVPAQRLTYFLTLATRFISYITLAGWLFTASVGFKQAFLPKAPAYRGFLAVIVPVVTILAILPAHPNVISLILQWSHVGLLLAGLGFPLLVLLASGLFRSGGRQP